MGHGPYSSFEAREKTRAPQDDGESGPAWPNFTAAWTAGGEKQ